jgi:hypothetical protein
MGMAHEDMETGPGIWYPPEKAKQHGKPCRNAEMIFPDLVDLFIEHLFHY